LDLRGSSPIRENAEAGPEMDKVNESVRNGWSDRSQADLDVLWVVMPVHGVNVCHSCWCRDPRGEI
jgi:hypothetical protein